MLIKILQKKLYKLRADEEYHYNLNCKSPGEHKEGCKFESGTDYDLLFNRHSIELLENILLEVKNEKEISKTVQQDEGLCDNRTIIKMARNKLPRLKNNNSSTQGRGLLGNNIKEK